MPSPVGYRIVHRGPDGLTQVDLKTNDVSQVFNHASTLTDPSVHRLFDDRSVGPTIPITNMVMPPTPTTKPAQRPLSDIFVGAGGTFSLFRGNEFVAAFNVSPRKWFGRGTTARPGRFVSLVTGLEPRTQVRNDDIGTSYEVQLEQRRYLGYLVSPTTISNESGDMLWVASEKATLHDQTLAITCLRARQAVLKHTITCDTEHGILRGYHTTRPNWPPPAPAPEIPAKRKNKRVAKRLNKPEMDLVDFTHQ